MRSICRGSIRDFVSVAGTLDGSVSRDIMTLRDTVTSSDLVTSGDNITSLSRDFVTSGDNIIYVTIRGRQFSMPL